MGAAAWHARAGSGASRAGRREHLGPSEHVTQGA